MTIELPARVEEELRVLAVTQSRGMGEILEDAIRLYIEASTITDLAAAEVAEAQERLVAEGRMVPARLDLTELGPPPELSCEMSISEALAAEREER